METGKKGRTLVHKSLEIFRWWKNISSPAQGQCHMPEKGKQAGLGAGGMAGD
jgi:hypothetical protein